MRLQSAWRKAMRGRIRSAFRPSDLSIRSRLIACFVLIVLLIIAADAVAIWQYWQIDALAQRVHKTDQIFDAVVRIHLDVYSFRDKMAALASSHDVRQFSSEAAEIRGSPTTAIGTRSVSGSANATARKCAAFALWNGSDWRRNAAR